MQFGPIRKIKLHSLKNYLIYIHIQSYKFKYDLPGSNINFFLLSSHNDPYFISAHVNQLTEINVLN